MSDTRRVELQETVLLGSVVEVVVNAEDEVIGLHRVDWNRDHLPNAAVVIEQVYRKIRPRDWDRLPDRVNQEAKERAAQLWDAHSDSYFTAEPGMTDLDDAIKDTELALRDAIIRHAPIPIDSLEDVLDGDWEVTEASDNLYEEYAYAAVRFVLDKRDS